MRRRLLLLGHTGKLGGALKAALSEDFDLAGRASRDFDAANPENLLSELDALQPEVIVNTVAFLGIDPCEREPDAAEAVNALFPALLAAWCAENNAILAHFSTDAVFGEGGSAPYSEEDAPAPIHRYGATKLAGEEAVRSTCPSHYVFRVPLLFGPGGRGGQLAERMIGLCAGGAAKLRVADDVVTSPTFTADVAARVRELLSGTAPFGTCHVSNGGLASLYRFMREAVGIAGFSTEIERGSWRDFPCAAPKNTFTPLVSVKTPPLRPWEEALREYLKR